MKILQNITKICCNDQFVANSDPPGQVRWPFPCPHWLNSCLQWCTTTNIKLCRENENGKPNNFLCTAAREGIRSVYKDWAGKPTNLTEESIDVRPLDKQNGLW